MIVKLLLCIFPIALAKQICVTTDMHWQSNNFKLNNHVVHHIPSTYDSVLNQCICPQQLIKNNQMWYTNGTMTENCDVQCESCITFAMISNIHHNNHNKKHHHHKKYKHHNLPRVTITIKSQPTTIATTTTTTKYITLQPTTSSTDIENTSEDVNDINDVSSDGDADTLPNDTLGDGDTSNDSSSNNISDTSGDGDTSGDEDTNSGNTVDFGNDGF